VTVTEDIQQLDAINEIVDPDHQHDGHPGA
jgi:hypothetical protein